jgi:hypothetical protein
MTNKQFRKVAKELLDWSPFYPYEYDVEWLWPCLAALMKRGWVFHHDTLGQSYVGAKSYGVVKAPDVAVGCTLDDAAEAACLIEVGEGYRRSSG